MEGQKTEPQYFAYFNNQNSVIRINCLRGGNDSSPNHVLKRMKDFLRIEGIKRTDEAWLIVDKDQWTDNQLYQLHEWAQKAENYNFALSNPKFELWLLLHFEDGDGVTSSQSCTQRLKRHLPDYDKGFDIRKITNVKINDAIKRAKQKDNPPCKDWPRAIGTTVYKLVENILCNS